MNWKEVLPGVPAWHERPSGLLVPTNADRPAVTDGDDRLPPGLPAQLPDLYVFARQPSSFEQFRPYPDEEELGYPTSTPQDLAFAAGHLTFETGMILLGQLAAHVEHLRGNAHAQLSLAQAVFGDRDLLTRLNHFARSVNFELEVFPPQHITALQRLLVLHGRDGALEEARSGQEQAIFNRIFFAMASLSDDRDLGSLADEGARERWLAYLIQNGTYNSRDALMETLTRQQTLFIETTADLGDHRDFCPVDEWFKEDYSLSISEQHALGFAVLASSKALDESVQVSERSVLGPDFFADLARKLARNPDHVMGIITAPRSWYADRFSAGQQTHRRAAWERTPFEIRPVLRLDDERFLLISPSAINSWITDGFYHRALDG